LNTVHNAAKELTLRCQIQALGDPRRALR